MMIEVIIASVVSVVGIVAYTVTRAKLMDVKIQLRGRNTARIGAVMMRADVFSALGYVAMVGGCTVRVLASGVACAMFMMISVVIMIKEIRKIRGDAKYAINNKR